LLVAIFVHFIATDVRAVAFEIRPGDQGQIVLISKLDKPFETSVVGDVDFDIFGLCSLSAESKDTTHRLALLVSGASVLVGFRWLLR
jgi:hypothetical protein